MTYDITDKTLAADGKKQIEWAETQMGGLLKIKERFLKEKPLKNMRIGMALHVTKETAVLVKTLIAGGAEVAITGCNPLSTQDPVAAALVNEGAHVYAKRGVNTKEYYEHINKIIDFKPQITIDDGCDLVTVIHTKRTDALENLIGGAEETTTGIIRLHAMEKEGILKYPMVSVNDSKTKHLMDNFIGTGQSTLDGVLRATSMLLAGKNLVVVGYGPCGKGVASRARGLGANVIVCEVDAFCALQAHYDGFRVMPMNEAAKIGNLFITITGDKHVISLEHMKLMKDGAILANSGHFDLEIDIASLSKESTKRNIRNNMDEYTLNGKKIFILGDGRLVNLAAAEGHPSEVMAMSFMNQALACEFIVKNKGTLKNKTYTLPVEIDDLVAQTQLDALGIKKVKLTEEQKKYLSGWQEGT